MGLHDKVNRLKGVGEKKTLLLEKINISNIEDFLYFYPRDYQDRRVAVKIRDAVLGKTTLIRARVLVVIADKYPYKKKSVLRILVRDDSGSLEILFFNAKYLANVFKQGIEYDFYGKIMIDKGKIQMIHPEFLQTQEQHEKGITPIYSLTAGISQSDMRKWQKIANGSLDQIEEYMPPAIIERNRLCGLQYALDNIHFPGDEQKLKEAKYRLIFDELFFLQAGLMSIKGRIAKNVRGIAFSKKIDASVYSSKLPYELTNAQLRVIDEIMRDMESKKTMNRLVQGDVGSGKTVIAEIALYKACKSGYQGVLMAPTELLAKQHYIGLKRNFETHGITVGFLSGNMKTKEKKETLTALRSGEIQILIGTHAIIQPDVQFENLGLVITDEQHRFGVNQRALLSQKGDEPDILVMSATPIPRTLAMILYGDLDHSILDELPPGRQRIITRAVSINQRNEAYEFIKREIEMGRQAYVVAPLIDDSVIVDAKSAESIYAELQESFSSHRVAMIHGEMKQKDKDEVMETFYDGRIDILVSTVVIEVGINIPNATVILIENAERFGLAQLHQLRGRVGRGKHQSHCILITDGESELAKARAEAMVNTSDGFIIAEKDLELRGPGEFFGTKQHGIPDLKIADLVKHIKILAVAREEAKRLLEEDPKLSSDENRFIKEKIQKQFNLVL